MASTEEIRSDLADIVNEVTGIPADDEQLDKSFTDDLDVDSLSMVKTVGDAVSYIENAQAAA